MKNVNEKNKLISLIIGKDQLLSQLLQQACNNKKSLVLIGGLRPLTLQNLMIRDSKPIFFTPFGKAFSSWAKDAFYEVWIIHLQKLPCWQMAGVQEFMALRLKECFYHSFTKLFPFCLKSPPTIVSYCSLTKKAKLIIFIGVFLGVFALKLINNFCSIARGIFFDHFLDDDL